MEPAYLLAVCIGCFDLMPLSGPVVPDRMAIRTTRFEDYRTSCFRLSSEHPDPLPQYDKPIPTLRGSGPQWASLGR